MIFYAYFVLSRSEKNKNPMDSNHSPPDSCSGRLSLASFHRSSTYLLGRGTGSRASRAVSVLKFRMLLIQTLVPCLNRIVMYGNI